MPKIVKEYIESGFASQFFRLLNADADLDMPTVRIMPSGCKFARRYVAEFSTPDRHLYVKIVPAILIAKADNVRFNRSILIRAITLNTIQDLCDWILSRPTDDLNKEYAICTMLFCLYLHAVNYDRRHSARSGFPQSLFLNSPLLSALAERDDWDLWLEFVAAVNEIVAKYKQLKSSKSSVTRMMTSLLSGGLDAKQTLMLTETAKSLLMKVLGAQVEALTEVLLREVTPRSPIRVAIS